MSKRKNNIVIFHTVLLVQFLQKKQNIIIFINYTILDKKKHLSIQINHIILLFDNFYPSENVEKENNIVYFHKVLLVQLLQKQTTL